MLQWQKDLVKASLTNTEIPDTVPTAGKFGFYIGSTAGRIGTFLKEKVIDKIPVLDNIANGFLTGYRCSRVDDTTEEISNIARTALGQSLSTFQRVVGEHFIDVSARPA